MIDTVMLTWFSLTGLSLMYVVYDCLKTNPAAGVQRLGWVLVVLYTGPFGLLAYAVSCRKPKNMAHDMHNKAVWKQALNSEVHCVAGDATGIIIAAMVVPLLSLSHSGDLVVEYVAAWIVGLLVFQAVMMKGMFGGSWTKAVRGTIFAETVSMNFVMIGMFPLMIILGHQMADAHDPAEPAFWFHMSMAIIVGSVTAYPINHWLVAKGLKHGCKAIPTEMGEMKMDMDHSKMDMSKNEHEMNHHPVSIATKGVLVIASFILMIISTYAALNFT
jgi:hypothetical protein